MMAKSEVAKMNGVGTVMTVYTDKVEIKPQGLRGLYYRGLKGTKTILFASVTAIQYREPGLILEGYIQFTLPGGNEARGGLLGSGFDENTFLFRGQAEMGAKVKEYIEKRIVTVRQPQVVQIQASATSTVSFTVELEKLTELHARGALTDDEFARSKGKLLS